MKTAWRKLCCGRLNIPEEPIRRDEDEEVEVETSVEKKTATVASEDAAKSSGPEPAGGEVGKEPVAG